MRLTPAAFFFLFFGTHMKRLQAFPAIIVALISVAAGGCHAPSTSSTTKTVSSGSEVTFMCERSTTGECAFILYSTVCEPAIGANGKTALKCTYALIDEFSIKDGESRKFANLSGTFKTCTQTPGKKMTFAECVLKN
jgi:hypothetical protein